METTVSGEKQIEALLTRKSHELAREVLGSHEISARSLRDVFTVKRSDIDRYIEECGLPRGSYCDREEPHDCEGIHFISRPDSWQLFWQERGRRRLFVKDFDNYDLAKKELVNMILLSAVPGLDFGG